jgi:pimeloyl-ACP methyl ester carboxylesterase
MLNSAGAAHSDRPAVGERPATEGAKYGWFSSGLFIGKRLNAGDGRLMLVNGLSLHVEVSGEGPPVLLLHGFPDSSDLWRHQVPALTAGGYRVITMDLRGYGASDKPAGVGDYRPSVVLGDVGGVLDQLHVDRVHLVGHDWGAAIAWVFAASSPGQLASLTCVSSGHPAAFWRAGWAQREKSWYMLLFQFGIAEEWLLRDDARNLRELLSDHPAAEEAVRRLQQPGAATAALGLYRAWAPPSALVAAPRPSAPVPVPVMGVWGSADRFLTEAQMTGSAAEVRGPWRYERVDGAGHWIPLDAPETISHLLLDFLGSLG